MPPGLSTVYHFVDIAINRNPVASYAQLHGVVVVYCCVLNLLSQHKRERLSSTYLHKHGTDVTLVRPWPGSNRNVCGDSFFASVAMAEVFYENGLRFTGVVKTSTYIFPKNYLYCAEKAGRRDSAILVTDVGLRTPQEFQNLAYAWVDKVKNVLRN